MRAARASVVVAVAALGLTGCTIRYSQNLVGEIRRVDTRPIQNADSGTEVGLLTARTVISFSEPESAHELMSLPCEVAFSQVDYRSKWYAYLISVNFPEVEVTSYCVGP